MSIEPSPTFGTRRSLRLRGFDYQTPGAYFVTVVTHARLCCFGDIIDRRMTLNDAGRMVLDAWRELPARFRNLKIDEVVVMPNHIHGILWIESSPGPSHTLGDIVGAFKSTTTVRYAAGVKRRAWPPFHGALWQRSYFDHIIRSEKACTPIREYIANNPGQWHEDEENPGRTKA